MAGETSTGTHAQVYTHSRMCAHDVENVLWLCFRFKVLCVSFFLLPSLFSFSLFVVFLSFEEGLPGCNGCALYKTKLVGGCVDAAQQLVEVGNRVEMGKSLKPPPQKTIAVRTLPKKTFCGWFAFLTERKCFLWFLRGRKYFFCGLPVALTKQFFERRVYFEPHCFCQQCCKTTVFLKESGLCTENNQYLQKIEFLSDHLAMRPVTGGEMKATRHF